MVFFFIKHFISTMLSLFCLLLLSFLEYRWKGRSVKIQDSRPRNSSHINSTNGNEIHLTLYSKNCSKNEMATRVGKKVSPSMVSCACRKCYKYFCCSN